MEKILSRRQSRTIEVLYALLVIDDTTQMEGILRRDTPIGTQPWITDDPDVINRMLELATGQFPGRPIRIATFIRKGHLV